MATFYWKELRMRIKDEDEASAKNHLYVRPSVSWYNGRKDYEIDA